MNRRLVFQSVGRLSILIIISLLSHITNLRAQSKNACEIYGTISDSQTSKPIEYATVFLSNTSLGTLTNKNGVYIIKNIPEGTYNLVCVIIGYEKVIQVVKILNRNSIKIDIALDEKPIIAKEMTVSGETPSEWQRRLKKFAKEFIGESSNADSCKIINPEIIDFEIQKNNSELIASAQDAIVIVNHALGYKIKIYLKDFAWSLSEEAGGFQIDLFFEELKSVNENEKNNWQINRMKTYKGSFRHFLKSCAEGNVYEEGFRLSKSHVTPELVYSNKSIYLLSQKKDEADLFLSTIIIKNNEDEYCVQYDKLVQVMYLFQEEPNYKKYKERRFGNGNSADKINEYYQNSWVMLPHGKLLFNNKDICSDASPYGKKFAGYWAWKRVADLLPYDYELPLSNDSNK